MAEKRMFTQKIIDSDAFLEMPLSAQALYFHLNMRADDDGFVNNPRRVTKLVSASEDDLKILLMKRFIIGFESGVIVIKHWRMHNTLKSDRYKPTQYQEELAMLGIKQNKAYTDHPEKLLPPSESDNGTKMDPNWFQSGSTLEPQNRLEEISKEKSSKEESICTTPESVAVLTILLNDGSEYPISQEFIDKMKPLFPAVDVEQQLRSMAAWCINNPGRRKTKRGVTRFINSWLSREQDRGPRNQQKQTSGRKYTTASEYVPPHAPSMDYYLNLGDKI